MGKYDEQAVLSFSSSLHRDGEPRIERARPSAGDGVCWLCLKDGDCIPRLLSTGTPSWMEWRGGVDGPQYQVIRAFEMAGAIARGPAAGARFHAGWSRPGWAPKTAQSIFLALPASFFYTGHSSSIRVSRSKGMDGLLVSTKRAARPFCTATWATVALFPGPWENLPEPVVTHSAMATFVRPSPWGIRTCPCPSR